jgi:hypothetical protein
VLIEILVYILTPLAAAVVVLTRLRLARGGAVAGQFQISRRLLMVHTVAGAAAVLLWVLFLAFPEDSVLGGAVVGIVALAFFWVTAIAGLLILSRWLPTRGRHAGERATDSWSEGPGLSVLAHGGLLVGVLVFTYAYLTSAV